MLKFNLLSAIFFLAISIQAQNKGLLERKNINVVKNGPYFGIQKGAFLVAEIGGERQWKDYQLRNPKPIHSTLDSIMILPMMSWAMVLDIGINLAISVLLMERIFFYERTLLIQSLDSRQ